MGPPEDKGPHGKPRVEGTGSGTGGERNNHHEVVVVGRGTVRRRHQAFYSGWAEEEEAWIPKFLEPKATVVFIGSDSI